MYDVSIDVSIDIHTSNDGERKIRGLPRRPCNVFHFETLIRVSRCLSIINDTGGKRTKAISTGKSPASEAKEKPNDDEASARSRSPFAVIRETDAANALFFATLKKADGCIVRHERGARERTRVLLILDISIVARPPSSELTGFQIIHGNGRLGKKSVAELSRRTFARDDRVFAASFSAPTKLPSCRKREGRRIFILG